MSLVSKIHTVLVRRIQQSTLFTSFRSVDAAWALWVGTHGGEDLWSLNPEASVAVRRPACWDRARESGLTTLKNSPVSRVDCTAAHIVRCWGRPRTRVILIITVCRVPRGDDNAAILKVMLTNLSGCHEDHGHGLSWQHCRRISRLLVARSSFSAHADYNSQCVHATEFRNIATSITSRPGDWSRRDSEMKMGFISWHCVRACRRVPSASVPPPHRALIAR